ncbi:hypothetical protein RR46_09228 [Papilio xuthus]|uniref:Uncharacterized protein n=1 Tax=Papilio xuthus TaxID=66420 RepID=A0A194PV96_PAPXU|nr:hypothetical protein RR46_09228 [Papilio xuthus]
MSQVRDVTGLTHGDDVGTHSPQPPPRSCLPSHHTVSTIYRTLFRLRHPRARAAPAPPLPAAPHCGVASVSFAPAVVVAVATMIGIVLRLKR